MRPLSVPTSRFTPHRCSTQYLISKLALVLAYLRILHTIEQYDYCMITGCGWVCPTILGGSGLATPATPPFSPSLRWPAVGKSERVRVWVRDCVCEWGSDECEWGWVWMSDGVSKWGCEWWCERVRVWEWVWASEGVSDGVSEWGCEWWCEQVRVWVHGVSEWGCEWWCEQVRVWVMVWARGCVNEWWCEWARVRVSEWDESEWASECECEWCEWVMVMVQGVKATFHWWCSDQLWYLLFQEWSSSWNVQQDWLLFHISVSDGVWARVGYAESIQQWYARCECALIHKCPTWWYSTREGVKGGFCVLAVSLVWVSDGPWVSDGVSQERVMKLLIASNVQNHPFPLDWLSIWSVVFFCLLTYTIEIGNILPQETSSNSFPCRPCRSWQPS